MNIQSYNFGRYLQWCETWPRKLRKGHRLKLFVYNEKFKCGGNRPFGRPSSRWENNIELDLKNSIGRRVLD